MVNPKPQDIETAVNQRLRTHELASEVGARALPGTARLGKWGWVVSVGTERDPVMTYQLLDEFVAVTHDLRKTEQLEVLISPSGLKPSEVTGSAEPQ